MSMINNIGYCPHCKQNVLLKREDIDVCVAIILFFFTVGIGLIIYLIIYYSKPQNRCVHCNSIVSPALTESVTKETTEVPVTPSSYSLNSNKEAIKFCAYCGEPIKSINTQYCAHCGTKIKE